MYRGTRLIAGDFKEEGKVDFVLRVREGDTMTGWEIIAGLTLEEQQGINLDCCPGVFKLVDGIGGCAIPKTQECLECWMKSLTALYRWNGKEWEAVKNGKWWSIDPIIKGE